MVGVTYPLVPIPEIQTETFPDSTPRWTISQSPYINTTSSGRALTEGICLMSFYTDVIAADPRFKTKQIVSDPALLEPIMRDAVKKIISDAALHGVALMAFETYRSKERQMLLFTQGATKLKNVGVHHYGLACDIVKSIGGKPSWKGDFTLLRDLAKHHGLIWGGDWGTPQMHHSFIDSVHVQRCSVGRQASLFAGTFYPDAAYNPYDDLP